MPQFPDLKGSFQFNRQQLEQIERCSIRKRYKRGVVIFHEEDPADGLYQIKSGFVKVYRESEDGREKTLAILSAGDFLGEMAAFGPPTRSASAKTLEPTEVLFIHQQHFEEFLRTIPAFGLLITQTVTERLREANKQIAHLVNLSSHDKVIYQVIALIERYGCQGKKGLMLKPRLTHGDIASLAGVSRETVTKTLKKMKDEGRVSAEGRRFIVPDLKRLNELLHNRKKAIRAGTTRNNLASPGIAGD